MARLTLWEKESLEHASYRNIDGERWRFFGTERRKDEAQKFAESLRSKGYRARVIKRKSGGYDVYTRKS